MEVVGGNWRTKTKFLSRASGSWIWTKRGRLALFCTNVDDIEAWSPLEDKELVEGCYGMVGAVCGGIGAHGTGICGETVVAICSVVGALDSEAVQLLDIWLWAHGLWSSVACSPCATILRGINWRGKKVIMFIKNNMAGYINSIGSRMKTPISLMLRTISNENTGIGFLGKFVNPIILQIREVTTAKNL